MNKSAKSTHHQGREQHLLIEMGWELIVGSFSVPFTFGEAFPRLYYQRNMLGMLPALSVWALLCFAPCSDAAGCLGCQRQLSSCVQIHRGFSWKRSVSYFLRINKTKDRPFQKVLQILSLCDWKLEKHFYIICVFQFSKHISCPTNSVKSK